jgi:hypothetical protein
MWGFSQQSLSQGAICLTDQLRGERYCIQEWRSTFCEMNPSRKDRADRERRFELEMQRKKGKVKPKNKPKRKR